MTNPSTQEIKMTKTELVAALRQSPIWKEDMNHHFQLTFRYQVPSEDSAVGGTI